MRLRRRLRLRLRRSLRRAPEEEGAFPGLLWDELEPEKKAETETETETEEEPAPEEEEEEEAFPGAPLAPATEHAQAAAAIEGQPLYYPEGGLRAVQAEFVTWRHMTVESILHAHEGGLHDELLRL